MAAFDAGIIAGVWVMNNMLWASIAAVSAYSAGNAQDMPPAPITEVLQESAPTADMPADTPVQQDAEQRSILPAGTPVIVMLNEELTTQASIKGDAFTITVLHDVVAEDTVIIPQGTTGIGEVTFVSRKGGFGKPGILGISVRSLDLGGETILLDGRYREEGGNNNGAVAATWVAVGIFSGFIKGKAGVIPQGRELKARTAEDIAFTVGAGSTAAKPGSEDAAAAEQIAAGYEVTDINEDVAASDIAGDAAQDTETPEIQY